ncbi:MAG: hypothetical protein AAF750_14380 [Planctomycetota bacterium]
MRQLLYLAKTFPGASPEIDRIVHELEKPSDLQRFVAGSHDGRGLLHYACWYDPWLMSDDLDPEHWPFDIKAKIIRNHEVWELGLTQNWESIKRASHRKQQFQEQAWMPYQLLEAYTAYQDHNGTARLFYARKRLGTSMDDSEVLGHA